MQTQRSKTIILTLSPIIKKSIQKNHILLYTLNNKTSKASQQIKSQIHSNSVLATGIGTAFTLKNPGIKFLKIFLQGID
jgi:hypothetical protein